MRYALLALFVLACDRGTSGGDSAAATKLPSPAPVPAAAKVTDVKPTCGIGGDTRLTGAGVGELQIGRLAGDIHRLCKVTRDTTELGAEALPERMLTVETMRDTLTVTVSEDRLWRISIDRAALRTDDSLGVGTPLTALLRSPGTTGAEGEGVLYVMLPRYCGMSFRLSTELAANQHRAAWSESELRKLSGPPVVTQVLITGCKRK